MMKMTKIYKCRMILKNAAFSQQIMIMMNDNCEQSNICQPRNQFSKQVHINNVEKTSSKTKDNWSYIVTNIIRLIKIN